MDPAEAWSHDMDDFCFWVGHMGVRSGRPTTTCIIIITSFLFCFGTGIFDMCWSSAQYSGDPGPELETRGPDLPFVSGT